MRLTHWRRPDRDRRSRRCTPVISPLEARALLAGPGDVTAPTTAVLLAGTAGQNGYFRGPVTVTLSPTDPDDPAATLTSFISVDGAPFAAGASRTITADGVHTVAFYSIDPAGNAEAVQTRTIRIDRTPPVIGAVANRTTLWPPNGKLVPVTITGQVADNLSGVATAVSYRVVDEYDAAEPSGTVPVDAAGNYEFTVFLPARRRGQDRDGRQFTVLVTATDQAGNPATTATLITVPHDQGRRKGPGGVLDRPGRDRDDRQDDDDGPRRRKNKKNGVPAFMVDLPGQKRGLDDDDSGPRGRGKGRGRSK